MRPPLWSRWQHPPQSPSICVLLWGWPLVQRCPCKPGEGQKLQGAGGEQSPQLSPAPQPVWGSLSTERHLLHGLLNSAGEVLK